MTMKKVLSDRFFIIIHNQKSKIVRVRVRVCAGLFFCITEKNIFSFVFFVFVFLFLFFVFCFCIRAVVVFVRLLYSCFTEVSIQQPFRRAVGVR